MSKSRGPWAHMFKCYSQLKTQEELSPQDYSLEMSSHPYSPLPPRAPEQQEGSMGGESASMRSFPAAFSITMAVSGVTMLFSRDICRARRVIDFLMVAVGAKLLCGETVSGLVPRSPCLAETMCSMDIM